MKKTLLVGFDAANWTYLRPLLEAGRLPALEKLFNQGSSGILWSTMPALTPAAWSSIITGKNPGKHGIFDMTYRRTGSYDFVPVSARNRQGTPFWQRLNEHGVRVGLVNIPFTYPPDRLDGFVVGGFGTPGSVSDITYPPEALRWIETEIGPYQPTVSPELLFGNDYDAIFDAEQKLQSQQVEIAARLADRYEVDVLVINLMILDHINHKMPDMADVEKAICQLDKDLDKLTAAFQADNVLVISDHGARRVKGDFLLHQWLRDEGYAFSAERPLAEQIEVVNWILQQWLQFDYGLSGTLEKLSRGILRNIVPRLPDRLAAPLWHRIEQVVPFAQTLTQFSERLDYSRTSAYPGGSYSSVIYLNQVDREPNGVVSAVQHGQLLDELKSKLLSIQDPDTGEPLFATVYEAKCEYEGAYSSWAPDLLIDSYQSNWNILSTFKRGPYVEKVRQGYFVDSQSDYGHHSRDGIIVAAGSDFAAGNHQIEGSVMDIPATLFHLYGVPIPEDLDGRSLTDIFEPAFLNQYPLQYQPGDVVVEYENVADGYSDSEAEEIANHLRALGYLG